MPVMKWSILLRVLSLLILSVSCDKPSDRSIALGVFRPGVPDVAPIENFARDIGRRRNEGVAVEEAALRRATIRSRRRSGRGRVVAIRSPEISESAGAGRGARALGDRDSRRLM